MMEPFSRQMIIDDPVGRLRRRSQSSLDLYEDGIVFRECTKVLRAVVTDQDIFRCLVESDAHVPVVFTSGLIHDVIFGKAGIHRQSLRGVC
jgi:hypothetical protein